MKFLVDVCIGAATENLLKQNLIHDLLFVRDINAKMKDDEIVNIAAKQERIVITADKDFGELVHQKRMKNHGIRKKLQNYKIRKSGGIFN